MHLRVCANFLVYNDRKETKKISQSIDKCNTRWYNMNIKNEEGSIKKRIYDYETFASRI